MTNLLENQQFVEFIDNFSKLTLATQTASFEEARQMSSKFFLSSNLSVEPVGRIDNKEIRGRDEHLIPIRIFTPKNSAKHPVLMFFHRGGWVFGNLEESDPLCRKISNHLDCIVVAVEYRLSPENSFPKPLNDCYDATQWVFENIEELGGGEDNLILCGESAGGNMAAAVALMARDKGGPKIACQLLINPMISSTIDVQAYENAVDKYFITKEAMKFFWSSYLQSPESAGHQYAALERTKNLSNLPATLIITSEYDPLHHEAMVFAERLKQSGVKTLVRTFEKVIHGFLDLPIYDEDQKNYWLDEIGKLSRQLCNTPYLE